MSKIKIVHLTSSLKIGGAENLLFDLLRSIDKNSFENYVIYFHHGPNAEKIKELGIQTFSVKGLFFKYDPIFFFRLFCLIKKLKPDCIHSLLWAANFCGTIIAKILNVPIVCALHLSSNFEATSKNNFVRSQLDKITFLFSNKLIAVSDTVLNEIKENFEIKIDKIQVIKNGIDLDFVTNQCKDEKLNKDKFDLTDENFVIGNIARFIPRKRHDLLIESFYLLSQKFPKMRLILIGSGDLQENLKIKCQNLNIQDKVLFINSNKAISFYEFFDCFVLPSDQEGLSIALLEAMSFELPSIVTGKQKCHEVIVHGYNGYIFEPDNKYELADTIEYIYKFPKRSIGQNAKSTILTNFNLSKMTQQYCKIFNELSNKTI